MSKNILITGATGLVGKQLVPALLARGHRITVLSRKKVDISGVKVFTWDVAKQTVEKEAFAGIDTIIHLAGEGIADEKWTDERKRQIISSRILSTKLLYDTITKLKTPVTAFISASAVGYYGDCGNKILREDTKPGSGFLSDCCVQWENAVDQGLKTGIRVVKIRIGLILSKEGGALPAMEKPIKMFVGAPLGTGKQLMPWVHIDDIVSIFIKAVEDNKLIGPYNACSPFPVTNKVLTEAIGYYLNRPIWPIRVPEFALKMLLGEMSILPLISNNTLSQKIQDTGFLFSYINLSDALDSIYSPKK